MTIATVVSSNSHIDYIARVLDDDELRPDASDHTFGQFVEIASGEGEEVIGVIYDSRLVNPEYGSFGPRTGPRAELGRRTADYLREHGMLIGILLLGTMSGSNVSHNVPKKIIPVGSNVIKLTDERFRRFHTSSSGRMQMHYYPQIVSNARQFALPLLDLIIGQLSAVSEPEDLQRLRVLKNSLHWQGTFGGIKL